MRTGKAAAVGPTPGVTTSVMGAIKVLDQPRTYLIDTPGVMVPRIDDPIVGLKLAVTGTAACQPRPRAPPRLVTLRSLANARRRRGSSWRGSGAIKDHLVGEVTLADFLLFLLNRQGGQVQYAARCGLAGPTDNVVDLLTAVSRRFGALREHGQPDLDASARIVLSLFRSGEFGRFTLDDLSPDAVAGFFRQPGWEPPAR